MLLFLGNVGSELDAKTALGIAQWRPEWCVGQWRLPGCQVDVGLPELSPDAAVAAGAQSLIVGVAPSGGALPEAWIDSLVLALESGLNLVSGLHVRLGSIAALGEAARRCDRRLIDVREPPSDIPLANGRRRAGRRLLTVGTDCCVGKKYTALAIHRALTGRGTAATFREIGRAHV